MPNSNNVEIVIKAVDQATAALKNVSSSLTKLGNSSTDINKVNSSLTKLSATSFGNIASGLKTIASGMASIAMQASAFALAQVGVAGLNSALEYGKQAFIEYNAEMEQARVSFATLLKSEDAAVYYIKELQKLSDETPFDFPGIQKAAKVMLAYGFSARDTIPYLRTLSDAAAGLSMQSDGIERIVTQLGQIQMKGKLLSEDIKPLTGMGIGVESILKEKFGKSIDELNKSKISIEEIIKGLMAGIDKEFGGLSAKQAKTFAGLMSTLKDQTAYVAGAIGEPLFVTFKNILSETGEWVGKLKAKINEVGMQKVFEEMVPPDLDKSIGGVYNSIYYLIEEIKKIAKETLTAKENFVLLKTALDSVAFSFGVVREVAVFVSAQIKQLTSSLGEFLNMAQGSIDIFKKFYKIASASSGDNKPLFSMPAISSQDVLPSNIQLQMGIGKQVYDKALSKWKELTADVTPWDIEKASWTKPDKVAENRGKDVINNTPGKKTFPSDGAGGGRGEDKVFKLANRIQDTFNDLNQKIISETGSSYQLGMSKINDEIDKMQRELVAKGKMEGLDTSALEAKIGEYQSVMTEPIKRAWRDAWIDMGNDTKLISAKMLDDKKAQAEAEFQIAIAGIEKEKQARLKALGTGDPVTDMQARIVVENEVGLKLAQAKKERDEKERQAEVEKFNMRIEYNQLDLDLNLRTQEEIDRLNRQELINKKAYLAEQLADEQKTARERLEIKRQLAETERSLQATPTTAAGGFVSGLKQTADSFGTWAKNMEEVGRQTAQSMQSAFQEFFFDAMTGQLKSLGDYVNSFLKGVARAISNALANAFAQKLISFILPGIGGRADGGPVYAGTPYVVGERGPEVFMPRQSGTIIPNHALAGGGQGAAPVVNVYNSSPQKTEVRQEAKWDGKRWVVNVIMEAVVNNTNGMRDLLAAKGAV